MDMKKLAARLDKLNNANGSGKKIWFKPNEEDQTVRILPYPHQDGKIPFIEVYFHYDIAGHRSVCCPQETLGESCPICKVAEEFRTMGGKENWYIFRDMQAKLRTYSPVIVRGKEEEGIKLWGYGKTIYEDLLTTSMEEGDISDLASGHDLTIKQIPVGAPGNDSTYPKPICKVQFKESPAMTDTKTLKKFIKEMPNYLEDEEVFKFNSYEELCNIVEKLKNEDSESEPESFNETTTVENPPVAANHDNDDLKTQLDDLLND